MKLAACVSAGNTENVTAGCIEHHRALGVDQFVILHIHSDDRTPEILRELERTSTDVKVVFGSSDNQFNQTGQKGFVELAKEITGADWIVRMDSDERWFVENGSLKEALAAVSDKSAIRVPRFNIVWSSPCEVGSAETNSILPLDGLPLALYPARISESALENLGIPWILTWTVPKCVMRNESEYFFSMGGHTVRSKLNPDVDIEPENRFDILIAQLAFTSFAQFERKLRWLSDWSARTKSWRAPGVAWHWDRYAAIHAEGPEAIEAEWQAQFLTPARARELVGHDVVFPGSAAFEQMRSQPPLMR